MGEVPPGNPYRISGFSYISWLFDIFEASLWIIKCVLSEIEWTKWRQIILQQFIRMIVLQSKTPKIVARLIPRTNPAAPPTSDKNCSHAEMKLICWTENSLLTIIRIFDVRYFTLMRDRYHGCHQSVEAWSGSFQNEINVFIIA